MDIKIFSKSQIKHYRPQTETVLISVQDVCDAHKSRNFVSHSLYRSILWLYFDDIEIATLAHKGVERRDGDPYIFHALRVANNKTYIRTKLQKAVAILHDVIEDTPFTRSFLAEKGINKSVLDVLDYLTHDEAKVSYEAYIEHICTNIDAMLVKLSDLHDNLDESTIPNITERDRKRFDKYLTAYGTILEVLRDKHPDIYETLID